MMTSYTCKEFLLEWDKELKDGKNCSTLRQLFCASSQRGVTKLHRTITNFEKH